VLFAIGGVLFLLDRFDIVRYLVWGLIFGTPALLCFQFKRRTGLTIVAQVFFCAAAFDIVAPILARRGGVDAFSGVVVPLVGGGAITVLMACGVTALATWLFGPAYGKPDAPQNLAKVDQESGPFTQTAPRRPETNHGPVALDTDKKLSPGPDHGITALPFAAAASASEPEWHVIRAGKELGPLLFAELVEKAVTGEIKADDLVKQTGGLWTKARDFGFLQEQFLLMDSREEARQEGLDQVAKKALLIGGCVLLAVVALVACGFGASYMSSRLLAHRGSEPEKVTVLVAKKNLHMGVLLKNPQDLFTEKQFAKGDEPKNGIVVYDVLKGKVLKRSLRGGDFVAPDDLADDRNNSGLNDALFYYNSGLACSREWDYDGAIRDYDEAIRLDPEYASAYYNRGKAWSCKGDYETAIKNFDEAIRLDRKNALAYVSRGIAWSHTGKRDKAFKDFDEAIRLDPKTAQAYEWRGSAWDSKNEYDKAIDDYDEAIRLDPLEATPYSARGHVWMMKKEHDKAIKDYDEAIHRSSGHSCALTYIDRAGASLAKKEYEAAIKDYDESIRLFPTPKAYDSLAWLLATCPEAQVRDGKRAIQLATKACDGMGWKSGQHLDTLAATYAESGHFDEAVRYETMALEAPHCFRQNEFRQRLELYKQRKPFRQSR